MRTYIKLALLIVAVTLVGCVHRTAVKDPVAEEAARLEAVKAAAHQAVLDASAQVGTAQAAVIAQKDSQLQAAANSNAEAALASAGVAGRQGTVVRDCIAETAATLGKKPQLTPERVTQLMNELDEAKTSAANLRAQHEVDMTAASQLAAKADAAESKLRVTATALDTVKSTTAATVLKATEQLAAAAKSEAIRARDAEQDAKSRAELNRNLMYVLCGFGALLIVGGVASLLPQLGGPHFTIAGAAGFAGIVLIGLGYYLPQLPLWVPTVVAVVVCVVLPVAMYFAYRRGLFTELPEKIGDIALPKT